MEDFENNHKYAIYEKFAVENEKSGYKLKVAGYTGNAGDSLSKHNGYRFTTRDRDNDAYNRNCAEVFYGAWWYIGCHYSNLNGMYVMVKNSSRGTGVIWATWKGYNYSLKTTRMMIRRA
ncbi:techylectin-5B-like [Mytilus edulis]|uniref:techylectin-5B-like n=1 Tax=Mytilus edulis TaxID=6550 RepID=UPI0039F07FD9